MTRLSYGLTGDTTYRRPNRRHHRCHQDYGAGEDPRYGIRTENTVVVAKDKLDEDAGQFYRFEMLACCPIDIRAVDVSLLSRDEIDWLNAYHKNVYNTLSPYLDEQRKGWLKKMTASI